MNDDPNANNHELRHPDLTEAIEEARGLRRADALEESQELLLELLEEYPNEPLVLFEVGGAYDVMGEVEMAIPYYRQAIGAGLDGDDLQECLICLGSSLRVVGESEEAVSILEQAVDEYPGRNSGRAFLALGYYSNGEYDKAVSLLLSLLIETTSDEDIQNYGDALEYYVDNLDETVDG